MHRRTFLKIAGMGGLSFAAGCTSEPEKTLFSLVEAPDDMVTGRATWYASTCRECPSGCGILAKNREGRVIKIEGNPLHPINRGKLCMRGQAALQGLYNPDRIRTPLLKESGKWRSISFPQAESLLRQKIGEAVVRGPNRIRMLTEVVGKNLMGLFTASLQKWRSRGPTVFEPLAYESLKTANHMVFGLEGLFSYHIHEADFLVSFGADFLETWLSPVAYTQKFKAMHALKDGEKGLFFQISPYQSLTGANSDLWLPCVPGGEAAVAYGMISEMLQQDKVVGLPEGVQAPLKKLLSYYTRERVIHDSGLTPEDYEKLMGHLLKSRRPLILGAGTGSSGVNALQTDVAVNLMNLILDPDLNLFDFTLRHRVEVAARRSEILEFFNHLEKDPVDLLFLNNVNPAFSLPSGGEVKAVLDRESIFVVSFSNFIDETTRLADLILPVALPLETWDEYGGIQGSVSTLQPAMKCLTGAPHMGDLLLRMAFGPERPIKNYMAYLYVNILEDKGIENEKDWVTTIQRGGIFDRTPHQPQSKPQVTPPGDMIPVLESISLPPRSPLSLVAAPSIRFFDGRGANRPWLCEVPDPLTQVAWHTTVLVHPETLRQADLKEGDIIQIQSDGGKLEAPVYETAGVSPGILVMGMGQGHQGYGRYAEGMGLNPIPLLSRKTDPVSGAPLLIAEPVSIKNTGRLTRIALMSGSRTQHHRKIALSVDLKELNKGKTHDAPGLSMKDFPLTLPLPEGYDRKRDIYPPHGHELYRWAMIVDLDKCIGCGACVAACYAENNVGVVGLKRVVEQREMSWLMVQRYHDPRQMEKITFLPMFCQHCDNAPCESVCPVYAPHHSKEGLNNQIYNRCIGTRFCSQNCPYKVRRFNWFTWEWPDPLHLQLNPDVTVRSKGVMEKCSFCIQRIKEAHGRAKDKKREILDGEIQPACLQTCPTGVFTFGNLMDRESRVRKLAEDRRAYQVMGYLNTKPAVIYLKKVVQEV
ncbi:MAG: 4Fe-4S dicluster domain-containing protein [Pseudomonadota bacterium]